MTTATTPRRPRTPHPAPDCGVTTVRGQEPHGYAENAPRTPTTPHPPRTFNGCGIENPCKTRTSASPRTPHPYRGTRARCGVPSRSANETHREETGAV